MKIREIGLYGYNNTTTPVFLTYEARGLIHKKTWIQVDNWSQIWGTNERSDIGCVFNFTAI